MLRDDAGADADVGAAGNDRLQNVGAAVSPQEIKLDALGGEEAALLAELGRRGLNEIHVEAGFKLNGSLIREGCVDELLLYLAPCLLGDAAQGMAALGELASLDARRKLAINETRMIENDLRLLARFV